MTEDDSRLTVKSLKKAGAKTPHLRDTKLEKGIERALEKRAVSNTEIDNIVNDIQDKAVMKGKISNEITTQELGDLVLEKLFETDKVAYIRFASVYRHFENIDEFIQEVKKVGGLG